MPSVAPYAPPLTLTPALLNRVAAIAEALGRWSARQDSQPSPRLRRENRIQTIQASLAIEQNSLSIEQVSALFDGQRVIGPARDIQEVRNAITAYDALPRWDPSNPQHLPRFKTNVVKQKRFSELLQASLTKYANRSIEAAQVIEELIAMAKQFRDEAERVDAMGLSAAEVAFYDALANNQSAQNLLGDEILMKMARELAEKLRGNLSIDWQYKENVRAKLRTMIKALLKRYKYPPDQEVAAIELVLQQTEMISEEWARQDLGDKI